MRVTSVCGEWLVLIAVPFCLAHKGRGCSGLHCHELAIEEVYVPPPLVQKQSSIWEGGLGGAPTDIIITKTSPKVQYITKLLNL